MGQVMQRGFLLEPCCKDESWIAAFLAYVVQFGGAAQARPARWGRPGTLTSRWVPPLIGRGEIGRVWPEL